VRTCRSKPRTRLSKLRLSPAPSKADIPISAETPHEPSPLHQTLRELNAVALIRGDTVTAKIFADALALAQEQQIRTEADLGPLVQAPPSQVDAEVIRQLRFIYEAGGWVLVESALADLPADLRWLFESGAVNLAQLETLHRTLGITSATDLAGELRRDAVRRIPGFDAGVEAAVAHALRSLRASIPRIPLGRAKALADPFLDRLRQHPGVLWAEPVGSLRRGQDSVGDIEILAPAEDPSMAFEALAMPDLTRYLHRGPRRLYVLTDRVQIGIRSPRPAVAGGTFLFLTGNPAHIEALGALATERGWRLEPEGLVKDAGSSVISETEEEIYAALGLPWIPPEVRNGDGEIAAAASGSLPVLVSRADIKGDLHMHTHFSDGRDTVEAMVAACASLGYEYLAITDHSPHSAASRNLSIESVKRQADEIAGLRSKFPGISILHGCEVDILLDGRLDFPDRTLQEFDIVLASLHDSGGQPPDQLMRRYLEAMRHPLVTIITHPTNRLIPYRRGYELDYDRLFASAVETRTVVEVDGAPSHLDLDGGLARRAAKAGATLVIDSDSHRADMLGHQMELGLLTARRGWIEPRHVLNTRPLAEVRAAIAAKRSG
jgi:DNA polymerase (family X)